jgi:ribosome biogenesis GTPase
VNTVALFTNLRKYGLSERFEQAVAMYDGLFPARVTEQHRDLYRVVTEAGEMSAKASGKLAYGADSQMSFPAVGDWVMVDRERVDYGDAVIYHILRRKSAFTRQAPGTANEQQIVAANIDTVFICVSLNEDFNLRRIERYLTIAWDSMAEPVIVLTKSDLCYDLPRILGELSTVSAGADVVVCTAKDEQPMGSESSLQAVTSYIGEGQTVAFIGSSGVGKSTLINRLMGRDVLAVKDIRENDGRGRHTTTHRQLLLLPGGGIVIDTPGMRELQIYTGNLSKTFYDIEELATGCRFSNCTHMSEPGCIVRKAIIDGRLSEKRLESFMKLRREMSYEGLNSRQLENEKINRMFGGKSEMKKALRYIKGKNR